MLKNYPYRDQDAGNPGGDYVKRLAQINSEREALEMNAQAMRKYNEIGKQTYSEINDLSKRFSKMAADEAFALEQSSTKLRSKEELLAAAAKNERINFDLRAKAEEFAGTAQEKYYEGLIKRNETEAKGIDDQIIKRDKINEQIGLMDNLLLSIDKVPFLGEMNLGKEALGAMDDALVQGATQTQALGKAFNVLGKGAMEAIKKIPLVLLVLGIKEFLDLLFEVNQETTELGRELGVSNSQAFSIRQHFVNIANSSENIRNTYKEIAKAQSSFNAALGTSSTMIRGDILDGIATIQNRLGLSEQAAVGLGKAALIARKPFNDITIAATEGFLAVENELGTRLQLNNTLKQAGELTGVLSALFVNNTKEIAEQITLAGVLGKTLEGVANQARKFLDFESSITAELEAEIFLNRELNFDRARTAALTRDYGTFMKEVVNEVGTLGDFLDMNVLQQEALAKAAGTTVDELANELISRTSINELKQIGRGVDAEALIQQKQQLSSQEAFNAALEKMKTIAINLVAMIDTSPLFSFLTETPEALTESVSQLTTRDNEDEIQGTINAQDFEIITHPMDTLVMAGGTGVRERDFQTDYEKRALALLEQIATKNLQIHMLNNSWETKSVNANEGDLRSDQRASTTFE